MLFTSTQGEGATCGPAYSRGRALCAPPQLHKYPPDGLLTLEEVEHDVVLNCHVIASEPFASHDRLDASPSPPAHLFLLTTTEELTTMNTSEDEPSFGLNGRLRPRKSYAPSLQSNKVTRKSEGKVQDKPKRLSTPTKTPPNKPDDLANKSDFSPTPQFLCPYCDRKFASKQTVSKHARRMHISSSKPDSFMACLFCDRSEANSNQIIRHMVESHSDVYFGCLYCHTRFLSTSELAEHKINVCDKQKSSYRSKLRQKGSSGIKKSKKVSKNVETDDFHSDVKEYQDNRGFNGVVISCELKPSQVHDGADIEENITTNLILPPSKSLGNSSSLEKNAVIVLDDIQWNKRIPPNFSFHNSDADQILSRLGVVHRSPRTAESNRKDWLRALDDSSQKFEKCFDTSFYSKVASNVQENLSKFLDGSFNFNPDPDNTIKTRKSKNSVVINTAEGFPILLAGEQYSRNVFDGYMPRAIAPKHKWKWDNLENDKNIMNPDQIKRDSHANNCIITLVSRLDIWTQLSMRRKFEEKFNSAPLEKKTAKRNTLGKELKEILESREIPTTSSQAVKASYKPITSSHELDFPSSLGLTPSVPSYDLPAAVLSGEWVRPRCYVCCACGAQTRDSRALSDHISVQHPNAQVQHYEIVGERLLNSDILKHLYVPPSQVCNRTRPPRGFRDCTKCGKSITLEDLHQHMLDCAGDTPTVRRRQCRYRPFGVRKRRPRLPDNTIRKKMRNDIRTRQKRQKSHIRPRPKIRTEVGDAETIRKMIADLPAKRHRVLVNPINQNSRPRRKLNQLRNKLIIKKRPSEDTKNRKNRVTRYASNQASKQGESSSSNVDIISNNVSSKEDDEDNKPLKPTTIKRVMNKRTRQNECVQRKTVISKAKRKAAPVKARIRNTGQFVNPVDGSVSSEVKQVSIDPEKIDVKGAAYNTREHANRGGSNNQDMQRPGCSRPDENSNNGSPPTQNVPLKHSIARLTANSETHDKSVQFSHSFLVQQECNNTNQHVPSGQHTLFENEAAITRLDKPPLNFSLIRSADYLALQKSKLNKPRKKLNDCIAMLKNKLVDPVPCGATSQVSVQCGTDEPIELEPLIPLQRAADSVDAKINSEQIETNQKNSTQDSPVETDCNKDITDQIHQSHESGQKIAIGHLQQDTSSIDPVTSLKQKDRVSKKKSKSVADPQPELVPQKPKKTQSDMEIIQQKCNVTTSATQKPSMTGLQCETNPLTINDVHGNLHEQQIKDLPKKCHSVQIQPLLPPEPKITCEKPPDKLTPFTNSSTEQEPSEVYVSTLVNKQKLTCEYPEHEDISQKQADSNAEQPLTKKTSDDGLPEGSLCEVQPEIPPAHASTHVDSILMTPLDLSGKIQVLSNSNEPSTQESCYSSDDCYETLDLSNKGLDERLRQQTIVMSDGAVDLSVKPSQTECQPSTLDLCIKSTHANSLTDLSVKAFEVDNVPTDLSVKGKDQGSALDLPGKRADDSNYVQDLSGHKAKFSLIERPHLFSGIDNEFPTDLSGKSAIVEPLSQVNEINFKPLISSTEDVPEKVNYSNVPEELQMKLTRQLGPFKEAPTHKKSYEKSVNAIQPRYIDKNSTIIQKPVYDPTLKIPQYKIRAASSTSVATTSGTSESIPLIQRHLQEPPSNENSHTIPVQERLPYDYRKVPFSTTTSMPVVTVPVYTLPDCPITSTLSKYESTTPVYTLANACISVSKIDPTSSATVTNTLISVPTTTIANTTSVYTLAGTTTGVPTNYGVVLNTGSNIPIAVNDNFTSTLHQKLGDPIEEQSKRADIANTQENKNVEAINLDQDAETARKIAMLPKELVDILGNMPVDHRNQLLNILPQYVSTTSITCVSQTDTVQTITNTTPLVLQKSPCLLSGSEQVNLDNTVTTSEPQIDCSSNVISTSPMVHQALKPCQPSVLLTGQFEANINHSTTLSLSPPTPPPVDLKIDTEHIETLPVKISQNSNVESITDDANFPKDVLNSATNRSLKINEYGKIQDRIIDLTCDENAPLNPDAVKVVEDLSRSINLPGQEVANFTTIAKVNKQKGNNDQTASLRAVRIKAPSERHKENQLLKSTPVKLISKTKNSSPNDNEVNKLSESNKYLAIQQAEISSTQHGSKNVVIEPKCTPEITPPISDGSTITTRRKSSLLDEIITKKDDASQNLDNYSQNPITKTGLVTSSISAIQISRKESTDTQINEKTVTDDLSNTFDPTLQGILPSENKFIEESIKKISNDDTAIEMTESNIPEQTVILEKSLERNNKKTDTPLTLTKNLEDNNIHEEDSDDDVSLAVIVKQKQEKMLTHFEQENHNKVPQNSKVSVSSKKRKKGKNLKTKILKENTLPEHTTLNKNTRPILKTPIAGGPIEESQEEEKNIVITDSMSEEHPKKTVKNSSYIDGEKIKLKKREEHATDTNQEYVTKISDESIENSLNLKEIETDNSKEKDGNNSGMLEVNDEPVIYDALEVSRQKKELSENFETVQDFSSITDTSSTKDTEHKNAKVKSTKKKRREGKSADVDSTELQPTSQYGNEMGTISKNSFEEKYIKDKKIEGANDVNSPILNESIQCMTTTVDDDREEKNSASSKFKGCKKNTRTKKSSETEFLKCNITSDMSTCHSEENTSTPLRRSRRGKSLYVEENFSSGQENIIHSEILPENKTPRTKKQLIFSKLLQDEENPNTNSVDTLESSNLEKDFTKPDDSSFSDLIPRISDNNYASELLQDKNKPFKRKKSPHIKQKPKKKKSLHNSQLTERDTPNIDRPQKNTKSMLKESTECNISPALNSMSSVLENTEQMEHTTEEKLPEQLGTVEMKQDNDIICNGLDNTVSPNSSIDDKVCESGNQTKLISTEKRKIDTLINDDSGSKPKKSKLLKNKDIGTLDKHGNSDLKTDEFASKTKILDMSGEPRTTACYNVPVAARRTRSRSVVVKSAVENFYDPYDIDLDDMLGNIDHEPLRKKGSETKETKKSNKLKSSNLSKVDNVDTEDTVLEMESIEIETPKKNKKIKSNESPTPNVDYNKLTKSGIETSTKTIENEMPSNTLDEKPMKPKLSAECGDSSDDVLDGAIERNNKGDISDSDDSSKSDVPLKKYVEEKEKKIAELSKSSEKVMEMNDKPKLPNKKPTRVNNETSGNFDYVPNETEEQLRSEQFMESFGFFSERKPRKSNLLATKKISETFHIIANECDDLYFGIKERNPKRQSEIAKSVEGEGSSTTTQCTSKKAVKRGRKKKICIEPTPCYCSICKKEFRRPDNYLRHQMTLLHVSKLSEIEMKVKTVPIQEEPNYLIAYKQHIDRLKILTDKLAKQKKNSKPKIVLPTMVEILADVNRTIRQQQLSRRGLSRDEALFLDCCELLKESHKTDGLHVESPALPSNVCTACPVCPTRTTSSGLDLLEKLINEDKEDTKSDGDVDSITAKTILESEEVRNLENDLISGLKEAANTHNQNNLSYHKKMAEMNMDSAGAETCTDNFSSPTVAESHYDNMEEFDVSEQPRLKTKDKMYPDITEIDLFEDKFDKIKRKCRSQAAAAKQSQTVVESSSSHKGRKKSDKKKGKKSSKKNYQNTVLTKGALKGFDGIKVSIPTSDINMPAIVQPLDITHKKKKKSSSKKKREKRVSESNNKYETDNRNKDCSFTQKKVDVYEFMDNEDAELFEFRPSTLMERFKSISNKEVPNTSKFDTAADEAEASSESASDGDDFVYMSDDYMCSDDETENSLLSCELGNLKIESKKFSFPLKRKDVVEKNAVMGKIFKNAVRTEKKSIKAKEPANPKANLDQLFDSLLEEEPSSSMLHNDSQSPVKDDFDDSCPNTSAPKYKPLSRKSIDHALSSKELTSFVSSEKCESDSSFISPKRHKSTTSPKDRVASPTKHDTVVTKLYEDDYLLLDYVPSTSKKQDIALPTIYGPSTSKNNDEELLSREKGSLKKREKNSSKKYDRSPSDHRDSSPSRSNDVLFDPKDKPIQDDNTEFDQELIMSDAGVARQRARRKCTVGKQNVLAETWSSESEPDGVLPRSNSAESVLSVVPRKKKARKKDGQQPTARRGRHVAFKKQDIESRVPSSNRNTPSSDSVIGGSRDGESARKDIEANDVREECPPPAAVAQGPQSAAGVRARSRAGAVPYYWSSEGDDDQEHLQQHGWIVGDSHKKLVTMLAHAKGRKRNNDDKRHLVE